MARARIRSSRRSDCCVCSVSMALCVVPALFPVRCVLLGVMRIDQRRGGGRGLLGCAEHRLLQFLSCSSPCFVSSCQECRIVPPWVLLLPGIKVGFLPELARGVLPVAAVLPRSLAPCPRRAGCMPSRSCPDLLRRGLSDHHLLVDLHGSRRRTILEPSPFLLKQRISCSPLLCSTLWVFVLVPLFSFSGAASSEGQLLAVAAAAVAGEPGRTPPRPAKRPKWPLGPARNGCAGSPPRCPLFGRHQPHVLELVVNIEIPAVRAATSYSTR